MYGGDAFLIRFWGCLWRIKWLPEQGLGIAESRNVLAANLTAFSLPPKHLFGRNTMNNRHETPAITPQFGCNSLMHSYMRKIMCSRGACFVSISVYFCLLLPPLILLGGFRPHRTRILHRPTSFTNQKGPPRRAFRCPAYARGWGKCPLSLAQAARIWTGGVHTHAALRPKRRGWAEISGRFSPRNARRRCVSLARPAPTKNQER